MDKLKMNELEKDAMRYRWLRQNQNANFYEDFGPEGTIDSIFVSDGEGSASAPNPDELDKFIDAAMEKTIHGRS
jgi:hypothetical protein